MTQRCDTCRYWEPETHAVGECGYGQGVTKADSCCQLWRSVEKPTRPEPAHLLVPDTEGGTRISLSLFGALKDWMRRRSR